MNAAFLSSMFGATILATACVLTGCVGDAGLDEGDLDEAAVETETGEAEQALEPLDPNPGNWFRLRVKHSGLCLEPVAEVAGAPMYQNACTSGPPAANDPQTFERVVLVSGAIRLKHVKSGLYMYIAGPSTDNGGMAVVMSYDPNRLNGAFAEGTGDPDFKSLTVTDSSRCLAIIGAYQGAKVGLYQWGTSCTGAHQKFHFDYDSAATP